LSPSSSYLRRSNGPFKKAPFAVISPFPSPSFSCTIPSEGSALSWRRREGEKERRREGEKERRSECLREGHVLVVERD
jgi:hypothetical protein